MRLEVPILLFALAGCTAGPESSLADVSPAAVCTGQPVVTLSGAG